MKHVEAVSLLAILFVSVSVISSAESDHCANIFDIQGHFVGTIQTIQPIKEIQARVFRPTILSGNGKQFSLKAGIYFVAPPSFAGSSSNPTSEGKFSFEDVTGQYLPLREWPAGDAEVADVNGDEREDIIFSLHDSKYDGTSDYRPRIWIQSPEGNFVDETNVRIPDLSVPCLDLELFDCDSDGDVDIFLTGYYLSETHHVPAALFINDGAGVFSDESSYRLPPLSDSAFVYFAEAVTIDSNQSIDLIVNVAGRCDPPDYQGVLPEIWLNNGNGIFARDTLGRLSDYGDYGFFELTTIDIDNDNQNDIIFANMNVIITDEYGSIIVELSGQNALYHNMGDGFFVDQTAERMPENNCFTRTLAVEDVDIDGDFDILEVGSVLMDTGNLVRLLFNDGTGNFSYLPGSLPEGILGHFNDADFAPLDDDDGPDLFMTKVLPGQADYDLLLLNNGNGTFSDSSSLLPHNLDFSVSCVLFDHQSDSDIDIFIANSGGGLTDTVGQNVLYHNTLLNPTNVVGNDATPILTLNLLANHPNPFKFTTTINYGLTKPGNVELGIYNVQGQLVEILVNDFQEAGNHSIVWSVDDFSPGVYFCRISIDDQYSVVKKAVCLK